MTKKLGKTPEEVIADWWVKPMPWNVTHNTSSPAERAQAISKELIYQLNHAGYYLCRMPGGLHEGYCPTCGCEPMRASGELMKKDGQ